MLPVVNSPRAFWPRPRPDHHHRVHRYGVISRRSLNIEPMALPMVSGPDDLFQECMLDLRFLAVQLEQHGPALFFLLVSQSRYYNFSLLQSHGIEDAMQRRRIKHTQSFEDRLAQEARNLREKALRAKAPQARDELFRKARQAETAAHINEWLSSPGLARPK